MLDQSEIRLMRVWMATHAHRAAVASESFSASTHVNPKGIQEGRKVTRAKGSFASIVLFVGEGNSSHFFAPRKANTEIKERNRDEHGAPETAIRRDKTN
jgi:hypothetical protein